MSKWRPSCPGFSFLKEMAEFTGRIPLTRPFSAKKKRKYDLFSPSVSCARLRRVQVLLKAEGISGLLCILGIDSRYNGGTKLLLNYLLFGYCDITADSISVKLTDEILEDLVVLIKLESVHVYCNPINYPHLLPYIGHWRNIHIHCLAEEQDDEEKAEEFKILSFISMVNGCSKIGIPYGHDGEHQKPFDPFTVEKWPLIQAFALEGFGGGGFFTMVHEITDVSVKLQDLYGMIDPVVAESLIMERLPLFEHHCRSVLTNIDVESTSSHSMADLTEHHISEPIVSYYAHGRMSREVSSPVDSNKPFVLFGTNTSRKYMDEIKHSPKSNHSHTLSASGIAGSPAKHMICFARDPKGIISSARTYFFGNGFVPLTENSASKPQSHQSLDLRLLIDVYLLAIDAVLESIKVYTRTQNIMQCENTVLTVLKLGMDKKKMSFGSSFLSKNVEFSLEASDFLGRKVELESEKFKPVIKMTCLYLYDIPSTEHPGKTLGSVAFGETFMDSVVKTLFPGSSCVLNGSHLVLTENVTRYASWLGDESEMLASKTLTEFAKSKETSVQFGKQLIAGDQGFLVGCTTCCWWEEGTLYAYEKGILFSHARFGVLALPLTELTRLQFYDGETSSAIALLTLTYKPCLTQHLPPYLVNDDSTLTLALMPRTRIFRQFYSEVLPLWKSSQGLEKPLLEETHDLSEYLTKVYSSLQEQLPVAHKGIQNMMQFRISSMPELKGYLAHLNVSSSSSMPVRSSDLDVLLGSSHNASAEESTNLELLLTIITGVPGSGKDQLCSSLVTLAKENSKWIVLRNPLCNSQIFDSKALQTSLSNTLSSQRKLHARLSASRKRLRVIIVTPGFTDIVDVVMAITNHPDPEVLKHIKIGAVTCCIDPDNMFMEERFTLPKLLDQCAQGWVNNIVFTSCLGPQNDQFAVAQKLIRACNPDAAFILAKGGEVTRTPDVELILSDSAFMEDSVAQKRHLMSPGWSLGIFSSGPMEPPTNEVCINFYTPLEKPRFLSKLRAIQAPLHIRDCHQSGVIHSLRGHIRFTDHNTITEVYWTSLNSSLSMNSVDVAAIPCPPNKPMQNGSIDHNIPIYFVVFTGFLLQEASLKDWLKECLKPRPQKKALKSKKDLTKKELADIVGKHKCDPLPEGWFYTGTLYISLTGEKAYRHPLLDKYVQQYLTGANEEINRHNAAVDVFQDVDMFQSPVHA